MSSGKGEETPGSVAAQADGALTITVLTIAVAARVIEKVGARRFIRAKVIG